MEAGLQVVNNDGYLQIDSKYSNYAFVGKQTLAVQSAPYYGQMYRITLPSNILVMVLLTGLSVGLVGARNVGSQREYTFHTGTVPSGTTITLYLFQVQPPISSTYGLEVFNSQGQLVFSGPGKWLKVVRNYILSDYTAQGPDQLPVGRQYAVMVGRVSGEVSVTWDDAPSVPTRSEDRTGPKFYIDGSSRLYIADSSYYSYKFNGSITPWSVSNRTMSAIVADVTGF